MDRFLFIWLGHDFYDEFHIVEAWDFKAALADFYKYLGKSSGIETEMFAKMIKPLNTEEAISIFNALKPMHAITAVFSGLCEMYDMRETEGENE